MYQKFAMLAALLMLLTACQAAPEPAEPSTVPPGPGETVSQEKPEPPKVEQPTTGVGEQPPATETPKEPAQKPDSLPMPTTQQEITDILREAILQKQETVQLDISQMTWVYGADLDLRNAYFNVLNQWPELKYAYDVQFSQTDQKMDYTIFYMPYQTDAYAQGIPEGAVEIPR